jgi:hypothetical protein
MGAAEGSIIPVIITAHMSQSRKRCGASHSGVIIQALAPVIGPYISLAKTMIQVQETRGRSRRAATRGHERVMWAEL